MSLEFNLFEAEDRLALECRAAIEAGSLPDEAARVLRRCLAGYERLLRETKQLVRLSDRREKDLNRLNKKLEQLTRSLAYRAEHDFLTGCLNKGAMTERLETALAGRDFGLILMDIDHFKRVNDTYGHPTGDTVLRGLADVVQEALDDNSLVGRMGGEEFAVLIERPTLIQAKAVAEQLRRVVEDASFEAGTAKLPITISLGVTACLRGESLATVYDRADQALYEAKSGGRNRVEARE